ncbi:MAG: pilin [Candidatus Altiarchaeota archaeon]
MNLNRKIIVGFMLILMTGFASAQNTSNNTALAEAQTNICNTLQNVYDLLIYIASGLAAVMIVVMGIAWITSADNSKTRTAAKEAVIHVIVGLIVVSLAVVLVNMVLPEGSDCITDWD